MLISSLGWLNRPATGVVHLLLIEHHDQGANRFLNYQFCLIGEHIGGGCIGILGKLGKLRVKAFSRKVFISYTFHQPRFYKLFIRITTILGPKPARWRAGRLWMGITRLVRD